MELRHLVHEDAVLRKVRVGARCQVEAAGAGAYQIEASRCRPRLVACSAPVLTQVRHDRPRERAAEVERGAGKRSLDPRSYDAQCWAMTEQAGTRVERVTGVSETYGP